jgi:hypothetical protein
MRRLHGYLAIVLVGFEAHAFAGDVNRKIIAELDPVAPSSAAYEETKNDIATSKWGGAVDFNMAGVISTGPEFWTGTFSQKGPDEDGKTFRREDMWPGERQKIDAIRLRWMLTKWELPGSMRGWFLKGGYSYTRINSRANRYSEEQGEGDAIPAGMFSAEPDDQTDLITDIRHGVAAGFGNRWLFFEQKVSVNLGASFTANFKRTVSIDSKDPNAQADYDDMIENLADTKMSTRPSPEINLGLGYAW